MIIATKSADTMLKRCLGKDQTMCFAIEKMIEQFIIDPTTTTPTRDAYIVTDQDISARRLKEMFESQLLVKHPATKVIFINKTSRPIYQNGLPGLDAVLQKPKPNDIVQTISSVIAANNVSSLVGEQTVTAPEIPTYMPEIPVPVMEQAPIPDMTPLMQQPEELVVPDAPPIPEPEPEPVTQKSGIVERIEHAGAVSDISVVMRELTATSLIKDLYETNSSYAGIEEKLKSLNDTIFNIMGDPSIKSLDEKLSKVHALMHDKAFFRAKGDTLIEQRLEEVIDVVCTQTASLLQQRLSEIDSAIRRSVEQKDMENVTARLAGLNEARANIIIELQTLEIEISDIFKASDGLIMDTVTDIAGKSNDPTGNEKINEALRARGGMILSDDSIDAIRAALECSRDKVPSAFKMMKSSVIRETLLLRKLFDMDQEVIAAQQSIINFLKANNIEDTVVAETLLKKSLRVYVAEDKVGRTIIPYLISRYKSRQNANVLLLDLTGSPKYDQYNIPYENLDTYMMDLQQREFMLAVGTVDDSIAAAQRLMTTLLKAADYYRVINIVMSPGQVELFKTISHDVLSVNFIVDTNVQRINAMRNFIENHGTIENVARRVIINRCDVPIRNIVTKLGLDDSLEFQACVVPENTVIIDAGLAGYDPYGISSVDLMMEEVIKHA